MNSLRIGLFLLCGLGIVSPLCAQTQTPPNLPPVLETPEPVLTHIPPDCLGYVVVNNIKTTTSNIDDFLMEIGVGQMISGGQELSVLNLIAAGAKLGAGFNPNGGFAAVMLNPEPLGIDLMELMDSGGPTGEGEIAKPGPPLVLIVPATSVEELFSNYQMQPGEKYTQVDLGMSASYATKVGGYVMVSPEARYLDAALAKTTEIIPQLDKAHTDAIAGSDIALHMNLKAASSLIDKAFEHMEKDLTALEQATPMGAFASSYKGVFSFYRSLLEQVENFTITGKFAESGLVIEEVVSLVPDSAIGKMVASFRSAPPSSLLDRLPDLPYVLAMGQITKGARQQTMNFEDELLDLLLKDIPEEQISQEMKTRIKTLNRQFTEQIDSVQMVVGGAPQGSGLFGLAYVMQCKDANTVKGLLSESAELTESVIKGMFGELATREQPKAVMTPEGKMVEEQVSVNLLDAMKIRYEKDSEPFGLVSVDTITVEHPILDQFAQTLGPVSLEQILGESMIRARVIAADNNTVVVTFGGGQAFLREAMQVAKGGGTIPTSGEAAEALKHLPPNTLGVFLVSPGNLFTVIERGMRSLVPSTPDQPQPPGPMLPFAIKTTTPIAAAASCSGNTVRTVLYVPRDLIREGAGAVMQFIMMRQMQSSPGGPGGPPTYTPEDF